MAYRKYTQVATTIVVAFFIKKENESKDIYMGKALLEDLVHSLRLEVVYGEDELNRYITTSDISRPGLELTGYFNYYPADRLQMFGMKEISFCEKMGHEERCIIMHKLCNPKVPAIIIARNLEIPEELLKCAKKAKVPVLRSPLATSRLGGDVTNYLEEKLAVRSSVHGVLMDIYGLGVLIQGDSGIGKSETGLELIKKGHRLIADDRVDVFQHESKVTGEAPDILKNMMEIRGVGIIDVMNLFGASAVRKSARIQLVVYLENWTKDKQFDRLGHGDETTRIADVDIPKISIPVKTGRNVATIIEVAAMNYRARSMGYDATKMFNDRLSKLIEENAKNE